MAGIEELKSLETLCRLNEQKLEMLEGYNAERVARETREADRLERVLADVSRTLEGIRNNMVQQHQELEHRIEDKVEQCSQAMREDIKNTYVTQTHFEQLTGKILTRITVVGGLMGTLIATAIVAAKYLT